MEGYWLVVVVESRLARGLKPVVLGRVCSCFVVAIAESDVNLDFLDVIVAFAGDEGTLAAMSNFFKHRAYIVRPGALYVWG